MSNVSEHLMEFLSMIKNETEIKMPPKMWEKHHSLNYDNLALVKTNLFRVGWWGDEIVGVYI